MLSQPGLHRASSLARAALRRQNSCLCAALKSFSRPQSTATHSASQQPEDNSSFISPDSLFSPHNSPWDKVFEGIEKSIPQHTGKRKGADHYPTALQRSGRNQSMTAREKNVFQEMFDMVFDVASAIQTGRVPSEVLNGSVHGVGKTTQYREIADLFSRLQKNVKRMRWTSEMDEELDRKKEEIELCDTDAQLLAWGMAEVFNPQQPTNTPIEGNAQISAAQNTQLYPHLIAALMRTFRDRFHDPHLALAIFDHAKNLSIQSYVFGCTAPVYNELIETRWFCFRDIKGILDALEEMKVNGVEANNRTRRIVEGIRRQAPSMQLLEEEDYFGKAQDRVMHILSLIELLVRRPLGPVRSKTIKRTTKPEKSWSEPWKDGDFNKIEHGENWSWGSWGSPVVT